MLYSDALPADTAVEKPPAGVDGGPITCSPTATQPASCYTTVDDFAHNTGWVKGHSCYTYHKTTPSAACPTTSCIRDPTIACPLYIKVSTIQVPCSTDCCPVTPTAYVDGPCPPCKQCSIPTEYITETTGCPWSGSVLFSATNNGNTRTVTTTGTFSGPTATAEATQCWIPEGCSKLDT
ncbi:hypothetical protein BJ170DRAFT_257166 [Xylariales sp. AK1849]|nr:hypothetical protein BJ170DRAFT_257166 [Xylariales sp. AK1849]